MNFYEQYGETYRATLIHYGCRFDHTKETAEDLYMESHLAIGNTYPNLTPGSYVKLMKTSMKNRYKNLVKKTKWIVENPFPTSLSPTPNISLDEYVCQREEVELLMMAMAGMKKEERDILQEKAIPGTFSYSQKFHAKEKLEQRLIALIVQTKVKPIRPICPTCLTPSLYFRLDALLWVCDSCGKMTKEPKVGE